MRIDAECWKVDESNSIAESTTLTGLRESTPVRNWLNPSTYDGYIMLNLIAWGHVVELLGSEDSGECVVFTDEDLTMRRHTATREEALEHAVEWLKKKCSFRKEK